MTVRRKPRANQDSESQSAEPSQPVASVSLGEQLPAGDVPEIPIDLTSLGDHELMSYFATMVSWQNYLATQLVEAEVAEHRAEGALRYEQDIAMMNMPTNGKVTAAKAALAKNEQVQQAKDVVIATYATRKATSVAFANCERTANLISRELSRRIATDPTNRRDNRWNP
jgi:hypothetical protein